MANDFYSHGGYPATGSAGASASARAEFDAIMAGFDKMPTLAAHALQLVRVNAGATALESTNTIDGIIIGSVTPAAGTFTSLSATGNVSLGDAAADTLSVSGSVIKNATNNWVLPAPSAGVTLALTGVSGTATLTVTNPGNTSALTVVSAAGSVRIQDSTNANYEWGWQNTGGTYRAVDYTRGGGTVVLSMSNTGAVTIAAPSAGTALTVNGLAATRAMVINGGNTAGTYLELQDATVSRGFIGTAQALTGSGTSTDFVVRAEGNLQFATGGASTRMTIATAGNVTVNTPGAGIPLSVAAGVAGAVSISYVASIGEGADKTLSSAGTALILAESATWQSLSLRTAGSSRIAVNNAGAVTINAPSSGLALQVTGLNGVAARFTGSGGTAYGGISIQDSGAGTREWLLLSGNSAVGEFSLFDNTAAATRLKVSTTGSFTINAPSSGNTLSLSSVAGASALTMATALSGGVSLAQLQNTSNTASSDALFAVQVAGSSAGDAYVRTTIAGVTDWSFGGDNSDSDAFVLSQSATLGTANRLRITTGGTVDIVAGSGNLLMANAITRFESAEQAPPTTTGSISVAHGGPRAPDQVMCVLRCKTAEQGYAIGDEVNLADQITDATRSLQVMANATNAAMIYTGAGLNVAIRNFSTGALVAITTANWKVVFKCLWL